MARYDLIIRNGTVHDGLGSAPRQADIALKDGRIAAVGSIQGDAAQTLDASGLLVTPGMVLLAPPGGKAPTAFIGMRTAWAF